MIGWKLQGVKLAYHRGRYENRSPDKRRRFPLSEPVPVKFVEGIATFRAKEVAGREKVQAPGRKKR